MPNLIDPALEFLMKNWMMGAGIAALLAVFFIVLAWKGVKPPPSTTELLRHD